MSTVPNGTKDVYQRELRVLVLPFFENFTVREVTVGRIELFLTKQREKSYPRAKHSRTILGMILAFAVRREIIPRNPRKEASRMKKPPHTPKALTTEQIAAIRLAAREWRTGDVPQECDAGERHDRHDDPDARARSADLRNVSAVAKCPGLQC